MKKETIERFWQKVAKSDECWEWTASRYRNGYGEFRSGGHSLAHRFAYEVSVGPIPEGMQIDHICHNKACVRPDHLRIVTCKQNQENPSGVYRNNTSGVRGVSWRKDIQKWVGQVKHNNKSHYVGAFTGLRQAEEAVTALRLRLFTHNDADRQQQHKAV